MYMFERLFMSRRNSADKCLLIPWPVEMASQVHAFQVKIDKKLRELEQYAKDWFSDQLGNTFWLFFLLPSPDYASWYLISSIDPWEDARWQHFESFSLSSMGITLVRYTIASCFMSWWARRDWTIDLIWNFRFTSYLMCSSSGSFYGGLLDGG